MTRLEIQPTRSINLRKALAIGKRLDGRPILSISGGETGDEDRYRPNALKRRGLSRSLVQQAKRERSRLIDEWRSRDRYAGVKDLSTKAIVSRHGLED